MRREKGRTILSRLEQGGCSRLLFPRLYQGQGSSRLEAVTVNISGGIAAGDQLQGSVKLGEKAELLLTSQAHERVYKARFEDGPGCMVIQCHLAEESYLEWLPHGTIFFNGARFKRHMTVDMAPGARFLYYESRIFGRYHADEVMKNLILKDHLTIRRGGELVLRDSVILEDRNYEKFFAHSAITGGRFVTATLVLASPQAENRLPAIRALESDQPYGLLASSVWNDMLVVRILAEKSWDLERLMARLLPLVRDNCPAPSSWRHQEI